jgi:4a-hydroxytetrahydrobiopterin dehydratase
VKPSATKKASNRLAKNALLNILMFPGLGSLMAGRWAAGMGQLALVTVGTVLLFVWLYKILAQYYGLMFGDTKQEHVGWIGILGGILFGISWLWALVTSLSLFREASREETQALAQNSPPVLAPADSQIPPVLDTVTGWERKGEVISRVYEFQDFAAAMVFVNAVAEIAEQAQHHPDVDIRWNKVRLAFTTHSAGRLTEKDFAMAGQCDGLSLR